MEQFYPTGPVSGRWSDPLADLNNRRSSHKRRRGHFSPMHSSGLSDGGDFEMIFETSHEKHPRSGATNNYM